MTVHLKDPVFDFLPRNVVAALTGMRLTSLDYHAKRGRLMPVDFGSRSYFTTQSVVEFLGAKRNGEFSKPTGRPRRSAASEDPIT